MTIVIVMTVVMNQIRPHARIDLYRKDPFVVEMEPQYMHQWYKMAFLIVQTKRMKEEYILPTGFLGDKSEYISLVVFHV
jgi:hypothetical protein